MAGTDRWIRAATALEALFVEAGKAGHLQSAYALTLNTAAPLSHHHVETALLHLFRTVPTLRSYFRERDDTLWVCDMDGERIDFQVVEESDPVKVAEELLRYRFQSDGPLWCARLLPPGAAYDPLSLPHFPHTYSLVLANHHGIADGTTNARIVNWFLHIINKVIANEPIDDTTQLGEYVSGEETEKHLLAIRSDLEKNPDQLQQMMETSIEHEKAVKLIPRAFGRPRSPDYKTKIRPITLDTDTTKSFLLKCKENGITVNSAIVALLNVSLVDLVSEAGLKQETYIVRQAHAVNCRRYWSGNTSRALGAHISAILEHTVTPANWRDDFWGFAKDIHATLLKSLQDLDPILFMCVFLMKTENTSESLFSQSPLELDHDTANLGDLDKMIPTEGEHVRLTNLIRASGVYNSPAMHLFHSLRGRFISCLCYADDVMSDEIAHQLANIITENLKTLI